MSWVKGMDYRMLGTFDYISPENTKNECVDPYKADVYSLGVSFVKLIVN